MPYLEVFAAGSVYSFFLVFLRTGMAIMLLPGYGEQLIPARIRLIIGLALSVAIMPVVSHAAPAPPPPPADMVWQFAMEFSVGAFIGTVARIIFSALHVAGQIIGQSVGLATFFPTIGAGFEGGSAVTSGLTMAGLVVIFLTDLHLVMIEAIVRSYAIFPLAQSIDWSELSKLAAKAVGRGFLLGVQFSAPFVVISFLFNLGLGLTNRMMAALPVFFIGMPLLLMGGMLLLVATLPAILMRQTDELDHWIRLIAF